jgi:hypothetical protein
MGSDSGSGALHPPSASTRKKVGKYPRYSGRCGNTSCRIAHRKDQSEILSDRPKRGEITTRILSYRKRERRKR